MVKRITVVCWLGMALVWMAAAAGVPVGTGFAYQGRLQQAGGPANGLYDFRFELFEAATGSNRVGASLTNGAVPVTSGLFSVQLDFGAGAFDGSARWLEISVRADTNDFTVLQPRQPVTPTPYALQAATVAQVPATNLFGLVPDALLSSNIARLDGNPQFTGSVTALSFSGDGSGLTNLPPTTATNAVKALIAASQTNASAIYVDALAGDDTTGQRGTGNAFKTIAAALSNAVNDTVVILRPGTHLIGCIPHRFDGVPLVAENHLGHLTNVTLLGYGATVQATNYGVALTFADCQGLTFLGIRWIGCPGGPNEPAGAGCLVSAGYSRDVIIKDCYFTDWPIQVVTCSVGFARSVSGLTVNGCTFRRVGTTNAAYLGGLADGACISGLIASDCMVTGNRAQDRICRFFEYEDNGQKTPGDCTNIIVSGNIITGLMDWGILLTGFRDHYVAHNVQVCDNLITYPPETEPNGRVGAIYLDSVEGGRVSGNQISNYKNWGNEGCAAIMVNGCREVSIERNLLDKCHPIGISAGAGLVNTGPSDNLIVRGNVLRNMIGWGIACGATNTTVSDNQIINPANHTAIICVASSPNPNLLVQGWCTNLVARNNTVRGSGDLPDSYFFYSLGTNDIALTLTRNRNESTANYFGLNAPYTLNYVDDQQTSDNGVSTQSLARKSLSVAALTVAQPIANLTQSAQSEADGNRYTVSFGSSSYTLASTNDVYFSNSTNRLAGPQVSYCILPSPVGRSLRFNPQWVFLNGTAPTSLAPGKAAVLTFRCFGDAEDRVFVTCELQP